MEQNSSIFTKLVLKPCWKGERKYVVGFMHLIWADNQYRTDERLNLAEGLSEVNTWIESHIQLITNVVFLFPIK